MTGNNAAADTCAPFRDPEAPFRVRLRYAAFDTFIEKFGPNVTRGGVFLASKTPFPVGTTFAFEIQLAAGEVALAGDGKVTWVKPFDPATPQKAHGMGVQFLRLDAASRELLGQILSRKTAGPAGAVRAPIPVTTTSSNHRRGTNGTGHQRVDTNVDLASEMGSTKRVCVVPPSDIESRRGGRSASSTSSRPC